MNRHLFPGALNEGQYYEGCITDLGSKNPMFHLYVKTGNIIRPAALSLEKLRDLKSDYAKCLDVRV